MPAYTYQETDGMTGGVIFAASDIEARRLGANTLNMDGISGMTVHRRKDLDQYEETGVPARVMIEEGWSCDCSGCGMTINDYSMEDAGLPLSGIVGIFVYDAYCSHQCRIEYLSDLARRKAFEAAFVEMMKDIIRKRFPGIDHNFHAHSHHAYSVAESGFLVVDTARVFFEFPGMRYSPAYLELRRPYSGQGYIKGPLKPEFYCPNIDRSSFEAMAKEFQT